ncbi:hypothetical protein CPBF426_30240 [Xanthomonas arboricola pv. juglandis]|nr:hypothetical protein CPBF426_30240 [Xanthomonas arboricola pv. juglandis]
MRSVVDAKSFILVANRTHENAGLYANKVFLKERKSRRRIAGVCISNLPKIVVQMTGQRNRQNFRYRSRIRDKNLVNRNE